MTSGTRLRPGEWVEYTRVAIDRLHLPGDDSDPNPYLWGVVLSVSDGPSGGVVRWRHQGGESRCLGVYLCRCGSDTRAIGCGGAQESPR